MDPTSAGSCPAAQPYTLTNMAATQQPELLHANEQPARVLIQREDHLVTPPTSTSEAVNSSSSKRAERRAASRSASPLGFGAGVRNLPSPIRTDLPRPTLSVLQRQTQEHSFDEPHHFVSNVSSSSLHGVDAYPATFSNYQSNVTATSGRQAYQSEASRIQEYSNGMRQNDSAYIQDPFDINPYRHRADEIGHRHNIPGITHLGDLLAPPGWKEGDEPISPLAASQIFESSREEARENLELNNEEAKNLPAQEQDKYVAEINKKWVAECTLDKALFKQRLAVFEKYQERKLAKMQRDDEQVSKFPRLTAAPAQPLNPPTTTSYAKSSQPAFQYAATLHGQPQKMNGMYPMRGQSVGGTFIDPSYESSVIDPSFMQQPRESAYRQYPTNQEETHRFNFENEHRYASHSNKLEPRHFQPPPHGQRARPFYSTRDEYRAAGQNHQYSTSVPRPPQYESATRTQCAEPNSSFGSRGFAEAHYNSTPPGFHQRGPLGYPVPGTQMNQAYAQDASHGSQGHAYENHSDVRHMSQDLGRYWPGPVEQNGPENHGITNASASEPKAGKENPAKPKRKRVPKEKPEKRKTWYHDEIKNMNLPTSVISAEALQAGYDYDVNAGSRSKAKKAEQSTQTPPKKRQRNKSMIDPSVGITISAQEGRLLIAQGAVDNTIQAYSTSNGSIGNGVAPVPSGLSTHASAYNPRPSEQPNSGISQNVQPEEFPELELSSEDADDPDDDDFDLKTSRRRASSPRKRASNSKARPNNKRKFDA